jgi:hypothetical protein
VNYLFLLLSTDPPVTRFDDVAESDALDSVSTVIVADFSEMEIEAIHHYDPPIAENTPSHSVKFGPPGLIRCL